MISCIKTLLFFTLTLVTINVTAQNGYSLLDSCYDNSDGLYEYTRSFLITTDSGSFQIDQFMGEPDTVWTTSAITPFELCNFSVFYDSMGRPIEVSYYLNDSAYWKLSRRTSFGYDVNGHLTDSIVQIDSVGLIVNSSLWHCEYDAFGKVTLNETKYWSSGQWINNNRDEWYFDIVGRDTLHITFSGDSINWIPTIKIRRIFNSVDLIDSLIYSWIGSNWNNLYRNQFFYQAQAQDTLELFYQGNGNNWDSLHAYNKVYDLNGNKISVTKKDYNGILWGNYSNIIFNYDSINRIILETTTLWVDTLWENSSRILSQYTGLNEVDVVYQLWVDTAWQCDSYAYHDYSSGQEITGGFNGDCNSRYVDSDVTSVFDSQGHLIYAAFDGHAGQSQGQFFYFYSGDFLYMQQGNSSTMGGITHDFVCYYYKPLTCVFISSSNGFCIGDSLEISINGGEEPYHIEWFLNDTLVANSSSDNKKFFPQVSGVYSVLVNDTMSNYFSQSIPVDLHPGVELGMDTIACSDALVSLTAGQFENYIWQDASTDSLFIASSPTQLADTIGYWVEVTDSSGCISRDSVSVVFEICIGVDELSDKLTQVFPNPVLSGEEFSVKGNIKADRITLANLSGEIVQELKIDNSEIYRPELEPGIYFLTIYTNEKMVVRKIIIL